MQFEDCALRLNAGDFASRSKAKVKPQGRDSVSSSTRTILSGERTWIDIEPQEVCIQMDKDAQKDLTYRMTQDEYFRYKQNWWISFN